MMCRAFKTFFPLKDSLKQLSLSLSLSFSCVSEACQNPIQKAAALGLPSLPGFKEMHSFKPSFVCFRHEEDGPAAGAAGSAGLATPAAAAAAATAAGGSG